MKFVLSLIISFLLLGCGSKKKTAVFPDVHSLSLQEQIDRMIPLLPFCEGMVAYPGKNSQSGLPNCNTGDGMITSAVVFSVQEGWPKNIYTEWVAGVKASIRADGMPFRNPSYARYAPTVDAFSRDQHIGFMHSLITIKDKEAAKRYLNYVKNNDWRVCEKDSDGRCNLIIPLGSKAVWKGMLYLMNDAYKFIGLPEVEHMSKTERIIDEQGVLLMAQTTPPGYQQHLVSQNIWLRTRLGLLTQNYAVAAKILAERMPNNLWFLALANLTNGGKDTKYDEIADRLVKCMAKWDKSGRHHTFSSDRTMSVCEERKEGASGHELVWLALFLQNAKLQKFKTLTSFKE